MEEKLYFKPAKYGKGIKKRKDNEDEKDHRARNLLIFLSFVVAVVLIILWLLRGRETANGQYPENVKNMALVCTVDNLKIPKIQSVNSNNKHIRVNAVFRGEEELKTIAIEYTLFYDDEDTAYGAEAVSHAELNKSLSASGYSSDVFDNKFARYGNQLIISLFANKLQLDETAAPYFMIVSDNNASIPHTLDELMENYKKQGFACEKTE